MTGQLTREKYLAIFERMLVMRRFEEAVVALAAEHPFGHYHLYIGQEATGAAVIEALRPDDLAVTTHRNHGHIVGRGTDPGKALAEIMGRSDGCNGGRGGTLHLCNRSAGFLSTSAVVGGSIGIATGGAYALKRQGGDGIAVAFFGDGALEEGIAFEAMNVAALWGLPVLFLCENNSPGAPGAKAGEYPSSVIAAKALVDIPGSLGIATDTVDGADAEAVHAAVGAMIDRLRDGQGPGFIEAVTERWPGSRPLWPELSTGVTDLAVAWDDGGISGEHAEWIRNHDPVLRLARRLLSAGHATQGDIAEVDRRVVGRMNDAKSFATSSPFPEPSSALDGAYA